MNETNDIFPVIVTYKCSGRAARAYRTLVAPAGFREFMVYDNSPASFPVGKSDLPPRAVYVRDTGNGGLSKAYNHAAAYARQRGYKRLLLLDQDTEFAPDAPAAYAAADRRIALWAPSVETVKGMPFSPGRARGWRVKAASLRPGVHSLHDYLPVNSGMCVDLEAFKAAGGYNEAVRLDFADYQFLRRLRGRTSTFALLPTVARQDFSGDEKDASALLDRFRLYLDSASHCESSTRSERLKLSYAVCLHALSLFRRTRKRIFLKLWLVKFVFQQ